MQFFVGATDAQIDSSEVFVRGSAYIVDQAECWRINCMKRPSIRKHKPPCPRGLGRPHTLGPLTL